MQELTNCGYILRGRAYEAGLEHAFVTAAVSANFVAIVTLRFYCPAIATSLDTVSVLIELETLDADAFVVGQDEI